MSGHPDFIPVLTVMVDYGGAPFLWIYDDPNETCHVTYNVSDGMYWYEEDDDSDYDSDDKEEYYYKPKKKKGTYHCPPYQKYYKR